MILNAENILTRTRSGFLIYVYVLQEHFPKKDIRSLLQQGSSLPNPFVANGQLQLCMERSAGTWTHYDLQLPSFRGNALDFAGHHFKTATQDELYYLLNQNLRLGLKIPAEELLEQLGSTEAGDRLPKLSFFKPPISNIFPSEALSLPQVFHRITGPDYLKATEHLRQLQDPKQVRQYKAAHFPYVTFAGCFEKRGDKHLLEASGLMVIDLDDLPRVEEVREILLAETLYETRLLFVSPSGRGLKWITAYPHREISHLDYFRLLCSYLEAVFGLTPDPSGKDLSRACFLCHDPSAYLHSQYLVEHKADLPRLDPKKQMLW